MWSFEGFIAQTILNPLLWNIIARNEYKNNTLTKIFRNQFYACYFLAFSIFTAGLWRDYLYKLALEEAPLDLPSFLIWPGCLLIVVGNVFVLSSMYQLGITGTYLGDYFGIYMKSKVTAFPFNVMNNPMYNGSSLIFLGTGLWYQRSLGIFLSIFVFLVYRIALLFEEPFTNQIYAKLKSKSKDQ